MHRDRIPKERVKNLPRPDKKTPAPNKAETRDRIINMLDIPKKAVKPITITRNLKYGSFRNFNFCKMYSSLLHFRRNFRIS